MPHHVLLVLRVGSILKVSQRCIAPRAVDVATLKPIRARAAKRSDDEDMDKEVALAAVE